MAGIFKSHLLGRLLDRRFKVQLGFVVLFTWPLPPKPLDWNYSHRQPPATPAPGPHGRSSLARFALVGRQRLAACQCVYRRALLSPSLAFSLRNSARRDTARVDTETPPPPPSPNESRFPFCERVRSKSLSIPPCVVGRSFVGSRSTSGGALPRVGSRCRRSLRHLASMGPLVHRQELSPRQTSDDPPGCGCASWRRTRGEHFRPRHIARFGGRAAGRPGEPPGFPRRRGRPTLQLLRVAVRLNIPMESLARDKGAGVEPYKCTQKQAFLSVARPLCCLQSNIAPYCLRSFTGLYNLQLAQRKHQHTHPTRL